MNYNPLNIKPGDIVMLDREFNNNSKVKVCKFTTKQLLAAIQAADGTGEKWVVMTNRLSLLKEGE